MTSPGWFETVLLVHTIDLEELWVLCNEEQALWQKSQRDRWDGVRPPQLLRHRGHQPLPLGGYGLQAGKFTISHQLGEISTRRVCFPTPGRCPGCCLQCSWLMESQRETRCVSTSPISSSASPKSDPVPTPLTGPSLCFSYPALCVSPIVLGILFPQG